MISRVSLCFIVLYWVFCVNKVYAADERCLSPDTNGCRERVVFEDNFNKFDPTKWRYNVRFSTFPDYEFVMYDRSKNNSYIRSSVLYLKPTLLADVVGDDFLYTGKIDLNSYPPMPQRCTSKPDSGECYRAAKGSNILPPIISSRLTSKIRFRYGSFIVRAKMPVGDWIYPQIELTSDSKKYGKSSGSIIIALTRGNRELKLNGTDNRIDFGTRWLEGGLYQSTYDPKSSKYFNARFDVEGWDKEFHTFRLDWYPGVFIWSVDDEQLGKMEIPKEGFLDWANTKMAPFDEEMTIALGLGVGGLQRFPDGITSFGNHKPWRNKSPKSMLTFWRNKKKWLPTWDDENTALKIDSIKVTNFYKG